MVDEITRKLERKDPVRKFKCGKEVLDVFLRAYAHKQMCAKLSTCFVWIKNDHIVGYYTLSSYSLDRCKLPEQLTTGMPNYPQYPMIMLGKLAIHKEHQGKGNGQLLLVDAFLRCNKASSEIGCFALVVEPIDEEAKQFYIMMGFHELPDSKMLIIPMDTIDELFQDEQEKE